MSRQTELIEKFEAWFFWFWIKNHRISYLLVLLLIVVGYVATMNIPKESSPSIKLGIVSIATVYPGTNPQDIDSLITDKIYKEVKDIKWIDKIESTSSLGVSSVVITLKTDAVVQDVLDEVRSNVARVSLPDDALDPNIQEIETDTSRAFSILIYDEDNSESRSYLLDKAKQIQEHLKWTPGIESVDIWYSSDSSPIGGGAGGVDAYDVEIILEKEKIDALGLDLNTIASTIKSLNLDLPIGNFSLGDKQYDYRISWKNTSSFEFLSTPLSIPNWWTITLWEISRIERDYASTTQDLVIVGDSGSGKEYIWLTINKTDWYSIFAASDAAKENIEEIFKTPEFSGLGFIYGSDLAETIREDYKALAREATTTLVLVFIVIYLFVWFKEAVFASVTLPLAFLATFILLYAMGYSLNFLTNFSLILSFGIAIDTIIVIVQAASSKIKIGYNPKSAILLAIKEYAVPIISGVATTIVVFVPMMTLPGILGKFLAYIPITIFGVLTFGLILALTVNSALYLLFTRRQNTYRENEEILEYADKDERELLELEREWKTKIADNERSFRMRFIEAMINSYKRVLKKFLMNKTLRRQSILIPVVFFFVWSALLAPRVGFELFPSDDNNIVNFAIEGTPGITTEKMVEMVWDIPPLFAGYKEIKTISISTSKNRTSISTELILKDTRKELWLMSVYDFEKEVLHKLAPLESKWLKVTSEALANGPPGGKAVGLNLIADSPERLSELIKISKDFQSGLREIPGTKNIGSSSQDTPGQFIFTLRKDILSDLSIPFSLIYGTITQNINGIKVGTIEDSGNDRDVVLKLEKFQDDVSPEDIQGITFAFAWRTYRVGDFLDVRPENAIASIKRSDGKIQITVDADLEVGVDSISTQNAFLTYAQEYSFPAGITYAVGWENEENKELLVAVGVSFFIACMTIFAILTLQFNSYSQSAVILYSVIMSLPFVMIGLILTDNQFSMPFGIWFIAFTGIWVNHGIILIDAINKNRAKGMDQIDLLVEAGASRLEPMILTNLTTVFGILPIALKDRFWSGMGFTIIFGLVATTFISLFVLKSVYYELYMNPEPSFIRRWYGSLQNMLTKKRKRN